MTTQPVKLTDKQLSEMTPWDIAGHYGIGYSGDMNPVEHGGYFYSMADWESYGYASCVEFWHDPDTGSLVVQTGTIHKPDDLGYMERAFSCIGAQPDERGNVHCQIDAVKSYCGIEPEGNFHPYMKTFNLANWPKEWRIWRSIRNWVEALEPTRAE